MNFRSSASFGKRQEFTAISELLRRGLDVYMTLVDDLQIDCIIRLEEERLRYLDIQIKARSKTAKNTGYFSAMEIRNPRSDFFFIFYDERTNIYWVIPSLDLVRLANVNKEGANAGKYSIRFCNETKSGWKPRPKFRCYQNAFHLLEALDEDHDDLQLHGGEVNVSSTDEALCL
jgi:hypothetical protein